jgi:CRISPR-associated protein Cas5d
MHWELHKIWVLKPIQHFSLRTNEVKCFAGRQPINIDSNRTQRNTVGLYDVDYIFEASFVLDARASHDVATNEDIFRRRVKNGACYHTPYLGMHPFICDVMAPPAQYTPIRLSRSFGRMLYGFDYTNKKPTPLYFEASMENGVVQIPSREYVLQNQGINHVP